MSLLLHSCCAPCTEGSLISLCDQTPTIFWDNPNIHPFTEHKNRLASLKIFTEKNNLPLVENSGYGLRKFLTAIEDFDNRCETCYRLRLQNTAKYAKENGYKKFTSTLFISPYQKHDLLRTICEELARQYNIEFLYRDFRPNFREGQRIARENGYYMQKYCGCIFSEEERYSK